MLKLMNLNKSYQVGNEKIDILHDINLVIQEGEYVSIMGPSGSGKSTLMNIIGCLDQPSSGSYWLENREVQNLSENELSDLRNKKIGFVFQNFNLLPRLTAFQNVELPLVYGKIDKKIRQERVVQALQQVGLSNRMDFLPAELSGGQKQRVAIARALVSQAKFLLADEPTGALDSKTSEQIMKLFSILHEQGKTILIITHEQEIADYSHRKIIVKDGKILESK